MNRDIEIKFDQKLRYKAIEIIAYWEGRLTTNHLGRLFGIGRQQASKDINFYMSTLAPGNLLYDKFLKGFRPSTGFKPQFTRCDVNEYLQLLNGSDNVLDSFLDTSLIDHSDTDVCIETLQPPQKNITPHILMALINAIRNHRKIALHYVSLNNPKSEQRYLEPHTLVFTGLRWHVRAFCNKNQDFRDFVLTRFRESAMAAGPAEHARETDQYWHHKVRIKLIPDTRLEPAQRKIIAYDYGMHRNALILETRAALVSYLLQHYQLDPNKIEAKPEAQQLMISNLKEVEKWLF